MTLSLEDARSLAQMLASNDGTPWSSAEYISDEGYTVFVEPDATWLRELQTGHAYVWINVPATELSGRPALDDGCRFSANMPRVTGRDLAALLAGQSVVLVPIMMTCDDDAAGGIRSDQHGEPERYPVYITAAPDRTQRPNAAERATKPLSGRESVAQVKRRVVPSRARRRQSGHR
ncbi:Uncharacterised protein [Mycobacteroides abscessus subsp. bolletii]|uniref:hypothetical protein n=1 Tax=Mycobacteroides abscessus TaxID=36809 RepID=UPI0009C8EF14|nr:hypothetical protein [Mycobacteroides abscessus]SKZ04166.1 Uncharacterised protein [Mycobacteroides abscessus subsp. bolletii]